MRWDVIPPSFDRESSGGWIRVWAWAVLFLPPLSLPLAPSLFVFFSMMISWGGSMQKGGSSSSKEKNGRPSVIGPSRGITCAPVASPCLRRALPEFRETINNKEPDGGFRTRGVRKESQTVSPEDVDTLETHRKVST
jgi:hypothetical protein